MATNKMSKVLEGIRVLDFGRAHAGRGRPEGYELETPIWAFARQGTPQAIVSQLSTAMSKAAGTPAFREFCTGQGLEVDIQAEARARANAPAELERWKKLVALSQLKPG